MYPPVIYAGAGGAAASVGGYSSDGGHSDSGYLSNGDISSIYGAYSLNKTRLEQGLQFEPRKRQRWTSPPQAFRKTRGTRIHHSSPPSIVHKLPSNVLFDIFTFYGANVFSEPGGHKYWWKTLALVCSKWNSIIRTWPSHFLGRLRFGNNEATSFFQNISLQRGISATHSLKRSPLLPLNLKYDLVHPSVQSSKGDEDDIVVLLQHLERVYSLQLRLSLSTWRLIAAATSGMPVSCTCIERIYLDTGDRATGFVLPSVFLKGHSPRLRTLIAIGVFPPSLSSLLLSPTRLTRLVLDGIPDSSHLPPRELLMHLRNMPQLQYLNIGFLSTTPYRRLAGDVSSLDRVALPNLTRFYFRGVCAYLESLVTKLDAVAVHELVFTLFHQLKYTIPHVSSFLRRTKRFGFDGIRINLWPDGLVIFATPAITSSDSPKDILCLRFPCARLDFQVASAAQICRALGPNFGNMEDLFVKYHQDQLPTQWHGEVDRSLWRELLSQFRGMKTLWISSALVSEVTASLAYDTLPLLEALPILAWIIVEIHRDDTSVAAARSLSELLAGVRSLGGPVIDVYQLLSDKWKTGTLPGM